MTDHEARRQVIAHRWQRADEAVASARDDLAAGRLHRAVNGAYYACFYAASAVLAAKGQDTSKHTAVRAAVHRDLIHRGLLEEEWGLVYSELMDDRHRGDYLDLVEFDAAVVAERVARAAAFVARLRELAAQQ